MTNPSLTVAELAERVGGRVEGDGTRTLDNVATLVVAGERSLSWVGNAQYVASLSQSRAAAVLVPDGWELPATNATLVRVTDPDLSLCEALRILSPPPDSVPIGVHPTAVVEPGASVDGAAIGPQVYVARGARIGARTQLHPGVRVGSDSVIGEDCVLWHNAVVRERVRIGSRVVIHANATIGADGFGYLQRDGTHHKIPQVGGVHIEDDVEIGANSCVDRARSGWTRIRKGTKIDNLAQIGHNVDVGEHCIIIAQCGIAGSVTMAGHVVLGGQVGIIDHMKIGAGAVVAAKSIVCSDLPDGVRVRGNPAVDNFAFGRQQVSLGRLPRLLDQFRELKRRVESLESAADDSRDR